ncbi:hypothetical protein [Companilactobacillus farciminis]|uniref:hypothetical protein n=1 Tax=Companilactobacillus farciminis TaxID=1612 RepID=UPI00241D2B92|nr:hypothetical protein [Companilactobacillus farciminis]
MIKMDKYTILQKKNSLSKIKGGYNHLAGSIGTGVGTAIRLFPEESWKAIKAISHIR